MLLPLTRHIPHQHHHPTGSINYLITRLPAAYRLHARHPASRKHLLKLIVRCNANPASLITAARVLHAVCNIQPCHLEAWQAHVVGEQWGFERHAAGWRRPELMRLLLAAALKISCNYHDDFTVSFSIAPSLHFSPRTHTHTLSLSLYLSLSLSLPLLVSFLSLLWMQWQRVL